MLQIFDCEQGTPEWLTCRLGIPTASKFATVMAKGEGKTRREYMLKLIGERLTGEPTQDYTNGHMERGKEMEAEARDMYCFVKDVEVQRVGFIRNGEKGCSPDSLVSNDGGVEIKTKLPHLQLDVLLRDRLPPEHVAQCQGFLWVAEREWVDFVSYWPKLPLFVKRVYRDEPYIKNLAAEVDAFNADMLELLERIQPTRAAA
jgi:hypothetical protein